MTTRMPSRLTRLEAGELEVDRRRRPAAARGSGTTPSRAGDLHLRLDERRAGGGHGDAGQHRAGVVGDRAVDAAAEFLCRGVATAATSSSVRHRQTHDSLFSLM